MKKILIVMLAAVMMTVCVSCAADTYGKTDAEEQTSVQTGLTEGFLFPDQDFTSDNYLEMEEEDAAAIRDILLLADWAESDVTEYTGPGIMIVQYRGKNGSDLACLYKTVFDNETGTFYDTEYCKEYTCSSVELEIVNGVLEGYVN